MTRILTRILTRTLTRILTRIVSGTQDLVVDARGIVRMARLTGLPVTVDVTHALQRPSSVLGPRHSAERERERERERDRGTEGLRVEQRKR